MQKIKLSHFLLFERTYMSYGVQPKDKEQIPDIPKKK